MFLFRFGIQLTAGSQHGPWTLPDSLNTWEVGVSVVCGATFVEDILGTGCVMKHRNRLVDYKWVDLTSD